ncbi:hydroxyacylglutathione hydrolase-like protein isoform X2 [Sciurus carolinensis]|uniref:hydroxyacylglutathione hydrolase-like protein isoform X2 n=1 Tax=Sciurus carolinensis TaxID=30640 RepID=UPI001FB20F40|nr:hydroxyacylglutathione hydrolase-like protein isoform X2 [Sciurus carolinensis]
MKVKVISVLEDNYMYLVIEEHTREAVAVDVAVPKRLLEIAGREGVTLTTVLTTHHHWDHARGNVELARLRPGMAVMGGDERICGLTRMLAHGEELRFGAIHVRCLLTPGHTSGHMSYFLWEDESLDPPALFSGDALSVAGCGWRLEGTAQQMYQSLAETLGTLPPQTVFCGHEHTLRNLEFAHTVEPHNDHVKAKLSWAQKRDEDDVPTVPSTLGEELLYNPFLRVVPPPQRRGGAQVHRSGGPGRGPGGAVQGAGSLPAGHGATAATGTGSACTAVGAPGPPQVSCTGPTRPHAAPPTSPRPPGPMQGWPWDTPPMPCLAGRPPWRVSKWYSPPLLSEMDTRASCSHTCCPSSAWALNSE